MNTKEIIRNIFMDVLALESDEINDESSNNDLNMDSIDKAEVVMEIEIQFSINITDSEFDSLKEFKDYVAVVERKLA